MNINDLPNEMMMYIFGYLDPRSLNNAVLICKWWKEIIEASCSWPCKITLQKQTIKQLTEFPLVTNRKINKFTIQAVQTKGVFTEEELQGVLDIIKRHGSTVTELFLYSCCWTIKFFVEILKCLPKLKQLIVYFFTLDYKEHVNLPQLIHLEIIQLVSSTDFGLMECLAKSKLKTMQIFSDNLTKSTIDWLRSQKHLETLAIRVDKSIQVIDQVLNETMPFKLKHLSILDSNDIINQSSGNYNTFFKFMESQSQTINSLELQVEFPISLYQLIFTKFNNLRSLKLCPDDLPIDATFYKNFKVKSVKYLYLEFGGEDEDCPPWFKEFIRCFPNVTEISLTNTYWKDTPSFLSKNLPLEKAHFEYFDNIPDGLQFPKLHSLNIKVFHVNSKWKRFVRNNSQIKDLTIQVLVAKYRRDKPMDIIQRLVDTLKPMKLETLRIAKYFQFVKGAVKTLRTATKVLDLHERFFTLQFHDELTCDGLRFHDDNFYDSIGVEFWTDNKYFGSLKERIYPYRHYCCFKYGFSECRECTLLKRKFKS